MSDHKHIWAFVALVMVILFAITISMSFRYFELVAEQDAEDLKLSADQTTEELRRSSYNTGANDALLEIIDEINVSFKQKGFVILPIETEDGNYTTTDFITIEQCQGELEFYLRENNLIE